jgi:archaellum component FlaF (FlaF/FlaG flagellin family)
MIRVLRLLVPLLLAAVATVTVALPAEAATFSASRTSIISGESVRFSGTLGKQPARKVLLQRRSGTRWVTVKSTTSRSTGAYSFSLRLTGTVGTTKTFRASAPRAGSRAAVTTPARTIRFVAQTATLSAPAKVTTGVTFTVTGTFRPVRSGRVTVLQRMVEGSWTEVARGRETSQGTTAFPVSVVPTGATLLRTVALASGGAPAKASASRALTVLPPVLQRMSQNADGVGGNGPSFAPAISADGRYVAFSSDATDLVPGDTNGMRDVFVRDQLTNEIERVSIADDEQQGQWGGEGASISADGRFVTFESSSQLTNDPLSGTQNIFVRDRNAGTTVKVSVPKPGDLVTTNNSYQSSISADGRYVAFVSLATNVVPNDTNAKADVFLRDLVAGTTVRVSTDNDGNQVDGASGWPRISADGSAVVYESVATNVVTDDSNGVKDVFWWPRATGSVLRVSETVNAVQADGASYQATVSADGRYVSFNSQSANLAPASNVSSDVLRKDMQTMALDLVSVNGAGQPTAWDAGSAWITGDGQQIVFVAFDPLAPGDTNAANDVYLRDLTLGTTRRLSDTRAGQPANGQVGTVTISRDGTAVAFSSQATNLVPESDDNAGNDVFHRDLTR